MFADGCAGGSLPHEADTEGKSVAYADGCVGGSLPHDDRPPRERATLREQFARARAVGPRFAMVVSWNEWTTGEQPSIEVSKDLEPSLTLGDRYLKLLKEEIRRFKTE